MQSTQIGQIGMAVIVPHWLQSGCFATSPAEPKWRSKEQKWHILAKLDAIVPKQDLILHHGVVIPNAKKFHQEQISKFPIFAHFLLVADSVTRLGDYLNLLGINVT